MTTWKKAPKELIDFLAENLKDVNCESRKMFGYPVYFINNIMFIGAHQENLFLRLAPEDKGEVQANYAEIKLFEPMPGRIMKEYVVLPAHIYTNQKIFNELLTKSIHYVSSLPPKEKKARKKK